MIKVIVAITTYNLEKYVSQAINSVLSQETDFDYKIVIADDCSTDGTIDILNKYKNMYPSKIELLFSDHNLGSLANSNRIFDGLNCEYFIFLDGDDYWLDKGMLQKQVNFLDSHSDYTLCAGNTRYLKNDKLLGFIVEKEKINKTYTFQSMLNDEIPFVHTSALMVRNVIFKDGLPRCFKDAENTFENCALRGEDFRRILHLEKGLLYVMDEVFSVYRIHDKGMWQGSAPIKREIECAISFNFYRKYFGDKYGNYFALKAKNAYVNLMSTLVIEHNLLGGLSIGSSEKELLIPYINDVNDESIYVNRDSKLKKRILRKLIRLFYIR